MYSYMVMIFINIAVVFLQIFYCQSFLLYHNGKLLNLYSVHYNHAGRPWIRQSFSNASNVQFHQLVWWLSEIIVTWQIKAPIFL